MFNKTKDKTKIVSLKLRAKVNNSKSSNMASNQTVSLAQIPMVNNHGEIAPPQDKIPGLYAMGKAPKPSERTTAKKSLRFDDAPDIPPSLVPSAPPAAEMPTVNNAVEEEGQEIIEHDTATQTASDLPRTEVVSEPDSATATTPIETTTTDTSESPEEGTAVSIAPSMGVPHPS